MAEITTRDCDHCGEAAGTVNLTGDGFLVWCQPCVDKEGREYMRQFDAWVTGQEAASAG